MKKGEVHGYTQVLQDEDPLDEVDKEQPVDREEETSTTVLPGSLGNALFPEVGDELLCQFSGQSKMNSLNAAHCCSNKNFMTLKMVCLLRWWINNKCSGFKRKERS